MLIVRRYQKKQECVIKTWRYFLGLATVKHIPSWTRILLPSWHLKKLARCMSYSPSCRTKNATYAQPSGRDHQCVFKFYSENAVRRVFFWISCSWFFSTLDYLVCFRFKFVSNFLSLAICWKVPWHENTDSYYLAFPKDRLYLKCLVYGVYVFESLQSILIIDALFRTFVTNFGDSQALDQVETLWLSVPILTAIGELSCITSRWLTS